MMNSTSGSVGTNNSYTVNNSTNIAADRTVELWVMCSINIAISLFVIIGNSLILWTVYKVESLHTVTSMFIANVSVVDLLTGFVVISMSVTTDFIMPLIKDTYTLNKQFCIARTFMLAFLYGLSLFGLIGIAIERYVAVIYPLRYNSLLTVNKAKVMIASIWLYILTISVVMFIDGVNVFQAEQECSMNNTLNRSYFTFIQINILVPILVIVFVYSKITWVALKHRSKIICQLASVDNARAVAYKNEHSIVKAATIVNVVFIIMYGQFVIISSVRSESEWYKTVWDVSSAIIRLNSGVNPWIFGICHKKYKNALLFALKIKPNEVLSE
ncbi:unnamed protein product [Owenia fusiformis]|uniref:Uncharacterized protein n=1 Tax=Owenia fusiformis TaxID=6347 RepID=A0A8J1UEQ6_OWEFU|nr:unnamed protein product [Owenia fusiformis]